MGHILTRLYVLYHERLLCDIAVGGRGNLPLRSPSEGGCIWILGTVIIGHYMGAQFPHKRISGDQATSVTSFCSHSWDGEERCAGGGEGCP